MDLEIDEVRPGGEPLVEQAPVVAFHDLVAVREIVRDPTVDVVQSFGRQAPFGAKTSVDRLRVAVAEVFDDHVEHCRVIQVVAGRDNRARGTKLEMRTPDTTRAAAAAMCGANCS